MFADAVMVFAFNIHPTASALPPPKYDKPYPNVEIVHDLPVVAGGAWGLTELPARKGGKCTIHLVPLATALADGHAGIEILDAVGLPGLIRHEMAHCGGLVHPDNDPAEWVAVRDEDRAKVAAIVRQQLSELTGQDDDAAPAPAPTTSPPRRGVAPSVP